MSTIFIINTSIESLNEARIEVQKKYFIDLIGNNKYYFILSTDDESYIDKDCIYVNCEESYDSLSSKIYRSINFINKNNFEYDFICKIDYNLFIYEKINKCDKRFSLSKVLNAMKKIEYNSEYFGLYKNATNKALFSSWFDKNRHKFRYPANYEIIDRLKEIDYFQGKMYFIGKNFSKFISENGRDLSEYFVYNLCGSEDVYIGFMHKVFLKNKDFLDEFNNIDELSDLTILIKTFLRKECLNKTLKSIRAIYKNVKILVVDDSGIEGKSNLCDKYYNIGFDKGLSFGRNFLVNKCNTKYSMIIDDDTVFGEKSDLYRAIRYVRKNSNKIKFFGGTIPDNKFFGCFEEKGDVLLKKHGVVRSIESGLICYDYIINIFICETDFLRDNPWDNDLKILEHAEFFYRMKCKNILSTRFDWFSFLNLAVRNLEYDKFRIDRINHFKKIQAKKCGFREVL